MLRANLPEPDRNAEFAQLAVERIVDDPAVARVDALASGLGTSVRSLQRLFAEHVGVGPKWVIRRYRLHEVTERMASGVQIAWAALAADLGYADQAHFVRDFRAMVGESPASIGSGTETVALRRTAAVRHADLLAPPGQRSFPGKLRRRAFDPAWRSTRAASGAFPVANALRCTASGAGGR